VNALAATADMALAAADGQREREQELVTDADARADDTVQAAEHSGGSFATARDALHCAGVTAALPDTISARKSERQIVSAMVRQRSSGDVEQLHRPTPAVVVLSPSDVAAALAQAGRVREAAALRATHAGTRLAEAVRLDDERRKVETAERKAEEAEQRAGEAAEQAELALDDRDETARELARRWRSWTADPTSVELLPGADWSATAVAPLILDVEALTGDDAPVTLAELDDAANVVGAPVRDQHAAALADLAAADRADAVKRDALVTEQAQLVAEHDPEPEQPTWVTSAADCGAPLWRAVGFADDVDSRQRPGIESALLAAGLLTATITDDGLTAADGQVLLTDTGPVAQRPLSDVLVVDAASPVPAEQVATVLSRISMGDRTHPTWIDVDGAWANGPLAGRHEGAAARYIGAEARAAARLARLDEIDIALAGLRGAEQRREQERRAVTELRNRLVEHLRTSPRSQALATARSLATKEAQRASNAAAEHHGLYRTAVALRQEWVAGLSTHRNNCAGFGLPTTPDELRSVRGHCEEAVRSVHNAEVMLQALDRASALHEQALAKVASTSAKRDKAETEADSHWRTWHDEEAELAAIRQSVGVAAADTKNRLRIAEAQLSSTRTGVKSARETASKLNDQAASSRVESRGANDKAARELANLAHVAQLLTTQLALPGVAAATVGELSEQMSFTQARPADIDAMVRAVQAKLHRLGGSVDENGLIRAQQTLERELSGTIDVHATIDSGIRLVELADATGHRTLMAAADELTRRCEEGAAALSDLERRVFTDFVLGGVAEELRRRLDQAKVLVKAMNTSLASIRTSHGIGVKLRWELMAEQDSRVARVRDLVQTADEVRPADDTIELTDLLKSMVNDAFLTDQSAGYAAHLTAALDYRAWHEVQVIITGPMPGQERRISRRAKLSQGETRFVSYVTLFAAVDAYLSGLPDTRTALRVILLDDAFAKVDDRTIGELMGLLVRLDLDFAMTGHALWGCYPQVPALDCYEVRRREGTPAVTTHVHWDGHNRHLRAAR
jgi:Putative exonuclease SbcCD, C subunit